jgi:hypothetical protein
MTKSDSIKNLAVDLGAFQAAVENVTKDAVNPFFKSKYASLEHIITQVKPLLAKNGLSYVQFPDVIDGQAGLTTMLIHFSGEWIAATSPLSMKDVTPQGQGSAITYMRRYALSSILGIATEDDDDGNVASAKVEAKPIAPKVAVQSKQGKKKAIADLLQMKALEDPTWLDGALLSADDYATACERYTGLALEEANFEAIIKKLIK